jgi:hypothetical protein
VRISGILPSNAMAAAVKKIYSTGIFSHPVKELQYLNHYYSAFAH